MPFWPPFLMAEERFVKITNSHRIKLSTWLFYQISLNPAQHHPWPTSFEEVAHIRLGGSIDPTR